MLRGLGQIRDLLVRGHGALQLGRVHRVAQLRRVSVQRLARDQVVEVVQVLRGQRQTTFYRLEQQVVLLRQLQVHLFLALVRQLVLENVVLDFCAREVLAADEAENVLV